VLKIPDEVQVWLVSDTHYSHKNILLPSYSNRPFRNVQDMNDELIARWNYRVGENDLVLHLGDFAMGPQTECEPVLKQLTGRKILVRGNHDKMFDKRPELAAYFESIHDILEVQHRGNVAVLCHNPIEIWNNAHKTPGYVHFHGHSHGNSRPIGGRLDVGVDAFCRKDYAPRTWDECMAEVKKNPYVATAHHGKDFSR
jgi:calcineurin-like phosphoesterase family protein